MKCFICWQAAEQSEEETFTVSDINDAVTVYSGVAVCPSHLQVVLAQSQKLMEMDQGKAEDNGRKLSVVKFDGGPKSH